jgi:broad specificity phosphatase PhoE
VTTFLFVRHAMTAPGPGDPGLTPEGRELARRVGRELRERKATYVYTSPLRRALETAREIALVLGLEVVVDERLRERTNWGDVPGETFEEFVARWDAVDRAASRRRIHAFVDEIAHRYRRATIIAVAHGGIVADQLGGHEHWPHCGVTETAA